MTSQARSTPADATAAFVSWLVTAGGGPAVAALPVNLVAHKLAGAAVRWFKRFRQTDDLSRLVKAAAGASFQLSRDEIQDLRKLLEKEQTWHLLAAGRLDEKLEELTGQIAGRLPPRDGRTAEETHAAAGAIARGLLEFAVFELEPEIFQKVVLARLQQMSDQASALDEALFRMHKDLYHLVGDAKDLFTLVSDRLPPGRADLNEVKIYLTTLIGWLNADPWPQRLGGPALTPAAIERKLRVSATDPMREQDADADELARQCSRLVILGGPGSGKTWLAMRTARICAEEALAALEAGTTLDEVELPLYTTCSRLVSAPAGVGIREAAASSAIARIGDLGGSRILKALCLLFTERDRRTLLMIDSLDEARDAGEARDRLREADSLLPPWRVVLTSRPSSWDNQLNIQNANPADRIGDLQPLLYPADVEAIIQQWFANSRPYGRALVNAIAGRPGLQQAATVPLVLAFYCILGSGRILSDDPARPAFRRDLYRQVIDRMLQGPWHSGGGRPPDQGACRAVLRTWAWPGVTENYPVSGIGQWEDDIPTEDVLLSPAGTIAVDHIAAPSGGPGYADETLRRFVHRSLREHLVAEHVASLPAEKAVQELLPHVWYDPDWEYTVPAAIAMHPEHDKVLRALLCRASRSAEVPADLSAVDAGGEVRKLLARVAAESTEKEWSSELVTIIGQARVELAHSGLVSDLAEAVHWPTSNHHVRATLLERLADNPDGRDATRLAATLASLDPAPEERRQALDALLSQLTEGADRWRTALLLGALVQLGPEPSDKQQARQALVALLTEEPSDQGAELSGGPSDRDEELPGRLSHEDAWLAMALAELGPTPDDVHTARGALLDLLADPYDLIADERVTYGLIQLTRKPEDKRQAREAILALLTGDVEPYMAKRLATAMIQLDPQPEDRRKTRDALLALFTGQAPATLGLAATVTELAKTPEDRRQTLNTVLGVLTGQAAGTATTDLAALVVQLHPEPDDERQALDALLARLHETPDSIEATRLAPLVVQLDPEPGDKHKARDAVLALLTGQIGAVAAVDLAAAVLQLNPERDDMRKARTVLLTLLTKHATGAVTEGQAMTWLLADQLRGSLGAELAGLIIQLAPSPEEKRKTLDALLALLTDQATGFVAAGLAAMVAQLEPEPEDQRQARDALLRLAADPNQGLHADRLAASFVQLEPVPDDECEARDALLHLLTRRAAGVLLADRVTGVEAEAVAAGLTRLHGTPEEMRRARDALLTLLSGRPAGTVAELLAVVLSLASTPEDKGEVRDMLLGLLARETKRAMAAELIRGVAQLDPTVHDLGAWATWAAPPAAELLAAVRRNSALEEWLEVLPSLSPLSS
jgi:hypothetical protein